MNELGEHLHLAVGKLFVRLEQAQTLVDELELEGGSQRAVVPHHLPDRLRHWMDLVMPNRPLLPLLIEPSIRVHLDLLARWVACGNDDNVARKRLAVKGMVHKQLLEDAHAARRVELVKEEAQCRLAMSFRIEEPGEQLQPLRTCHHLVNGTGSMSADVMRSESCVHIHREEGPVELAR
eukprot:scaffold218437_cov28-Tisochrysis_lutea.AAC.1